MRLKTLFGLALLTLTPTAAADDVTTAARKEANSLAKQYVSATCKSDYDLDTDSYRHLSATQLRAKRDEIYRDWREDLAENAKENGDTYEIRYNNSRVWYWQRDAKTGKREFKIVTLTANGTRELSCKL